MIEKDKQDENLKAVKKWAKKAEDSVDEVTLRHTIIATKGKDRVEIIPENGWAYVHGKDGLKTYSTNIESWDELDDAIKRMTARRDQELSNNKER